MPEMINASATPYEVTEPTYVYDMYVATMRQYIISAAYFAANAMPMPNCSLQGAVKGTIITIVLFTHND